MTADTPVPRQLSEEERALWEKAEAYRVADAAADEYAARDDDFNAAEYRRVSEAAKSARLALAEAATSSVILSLLTALSSAREAGERLEADYIAACGERDALATHGPEMARDTERLNWLQRQVHDTRDGSIGDVALLGSWTGIAVEVGRTPIIAYGEGPNLRAAIDLAASTPTETAHD